uniref:Mannose-binding lectin n=1 Tax=Wolffia arrhiza TaxID=161111 RepID=E2ICK0_WOLAR|nr:mannose-binding lectin [Wolffia arrhiza]ADY38659.1 putative mannose-binding lectin [Wolffia arrhiza]
MESNHFLTYSLLLIVLLSSSCAARNVLFSGERLFAGDSLVLGNYVLTMQGDCNLVFYAPAAIWSSGTFNRGYNCYATLLNNGYFVVYDGAGTPLWWAGRNTGTGYYILILLENRNIVLYGPARWVSGTYVRGVGGHSFIGNTTTTGIPEKGKKP